MGMHTEPRCKNCKYQQSGKGNDYLCGLLRAKNDEPVVVVTLVTKFARYENCAYRYWDRMLSANAPLSAEELILLAQKARVSETVRSRHSIAA